jgi:hypothetical protein
MVRYRAKFTQRLSAPGRHDLIGAGPNRRQAPVFLERPSQHGGDAANRSAGLPGARPRIGAPRVGVADIGGEEFDIEPAGGIAGVRRMRQITAIRSWDSPFVVQNLCEVCQLDDCQT